jgi:molecular chaperone HtpG
MTTTTTDFYQFKAEIKQLLRILVHSLYKDRDIFLRELISNASDALTRMQFEMLTNRDALDPEVELAVHIEIPEVEEGEKKRIVVKDSGIGMNQAELVQNLGTIAQSGAREFLERIKAGEDEVGDIIGQFGVGFYSVFMVADEVCVVSRSYRLEDEAAAWTSDGSESYRVETAEKPDRGTEIHITLKEDAGEFASDWKLRQIVKKHSDFVRFPIYVGEEQANQQTALWRKPSSEATAEDYKQFYQQMTLDFEPPLRSIHFASDAPVHIRALLFVPRKRDRGMLSARREPGLMLYSHNVLIQEYCTDLLPEWLNFVDGVVDSEDLPLNVSRETVHNNRMVRHLAKMVRKRVLRELEHTAAEDVEAYQTFWEEYGRTLKEGLATDIAAKKEILPLLRYASSRSEGQPISLNEYIEQMPESQTEIYYVLGDSINSVANSPHLDPFKVRDLEVLFWVDPLDAFVAPMLTEYQEKPFRNIDDAEIELPDLEETADGETVESSIPETDFNRFVGRCVTTLGERVTEVRPSKVLKDSPIRLVSPKDAANREMDRIYRHLDKNYEVPKRILEVNRSHPLIASLAHLVSEQPDNELINLSIEQLYENALIQEGLHPNPGDMLPRIQRLIGLAAEAHK